MKQRVLASAVCLLTFVVFGTLPAADCKDEAVKKDRKLYEGIWQVVSLEIDGVMAAEEDTKKITVTNETDGKWTIDADGKTVGRGTSVIDPTKKLKTVDLTVTESEDKDKTALGIYEFSDDARTVCIAPAGKEWPTEFSAPSGSGHILAVLKRVNK